MSECEKLISYPSIPIFLCGDTAKNTYIKVLCVFKKRYNFAADNNGKRLNNEKSNYCFDSLRYTKPEFLA